MRDDKTQSQRKFGDIPASAMKGPIDAKNYSYRAEAHASTKSHYRGGFHPTIKKDNSEEFVAWRRYFDQHLRGRPWPFAALMRGEIKEMCVPESVPQIFDPSFDPAGRWKSP